MSATELSQLMKRRLHTLPDGEYSKTLSLKGLNQREERHVELGLNLETRITPS